jgi:hypothetical protein
MAVVVAAVAMAAAVVVEAVMGVESILLAYKVDIPFLLVQEDLMQR